MNFLAHSMYFLISEGRDTPWNIFRAYLTGTSIWCLLGILRFAEYSLGNTRSEWRMCTLGNGNRREQCNWSHLGSNEHGGQLHMRSWHTLVHDSQNADFFSKIFRSDPLCLFIICKDPVMQKNRRKNPARCLWKKATAEFKKYYPEKSEKDLLSEEDLPPHPE